MRTFQFEATGNGNWGRFLVGVLDTEWEWTSDTADGMRTLTTTGYSHDSLWVLDLVTREGANFAPHGLAAADLDKHRIWVCPMFEPFLAWLYRELAGVRGWHYVDTLAQLPQVVELPDAPFALYGHRREGNDDDVTDG